MSDERIIGGRYRVHRELGGGAQGRVSLALDLVFNSEVAIKELTDPDRSEDHLRRFREDARFLRELKHPHIVTVFDLVLDHDPPFMVMEYCEGGDLRWLLLRRSPLTLERVLRIGCEILDGLAYTHERTPPILHRDVKPENVLFTQGVSKLVDFGLAKRHGSDSSLTQSTVGFMGTLMYASPEQIWDPRSVDHRSDLWACGLIVYEMLTWRRPFKNPGDLDVTVIDRVRTQPPLPPPFGLEPELTDWIRRALEKAPQDRFQTAREMSVALEQVRAALGHRLDVSYPPADLVDDACRYAQRVMELVDGERTEDLKQAFRQLPNNLRDSSLVSALRKRIVTRSTPSRASQPRASSSRADDISRLIRERKLTEVRPKIAEWLHEKKDDPQGQHLLELFQEAQQRYFSDFDDARNEQRRMLTDHGLEREPALAAVQQLWERMASLYPDDPVCERELALVRAELGLEKRKQSFRRAEEQVAVLEREGRLAEALALWDEHLAGFPTDPEAPRRREALRVRQREQERAAKRSVLAEEASRLEREGHLAEAAARWQAIAGLEKDPAAALREVERLERSVADAERERALAAALEAVEDDRAQGDLSTAVSRLAAFLRSYPGNPSAAVRLAELERERSEHERRAHAAVVEELRTRLERRRSGGRYDSLEGGRERSTAVLARTEVSERADPSALGEARAVLARVSEALEGELLRRLQEARQGLLARVAEARGLLGGRVGTSADEEAAAKTLEETLGEALRALVSRDEGSDPLAPLARASRALEAASHALVGIREDSLREGRERCSGALDSVQRVLTSLARSAAPEETTRALESAFAALEQRARSGLPEELTVVAREATALEGRARVLVASRSWKLVEELQDELQEAWPMLALTEDRELEEAVRSATKVGAGAPHAPEPAAVRAQLGQALARVRADVDSRMARSRASWEEALAQWCELLDADLGPFVRKEGEELKASALLAEQSARSELLAECTEHLQVLIRRYRLESVWIESEEAIGALEGPLDRSGVPRHEPSAEVTRPLESYRQAVAAGDWRTAHGAARELGKLAETSPVDEPVMLAALPPLSARARKLNEALLPGVVRRFDELLAREGEARRRNNAVEASRTRAELERESRKLVEPSRPLLGWMLAGAALAVIGVAGGLVASRAIGEPTHEVTALVVGGGVPILEGVEARSEKIAEGVYRWELAAGEHRAAVGDTAVSFNVPRQRHVVLVSQAPGAADASDRIKGLLGLE